MNFPNKITISRIILIIRIIIAMFVLAFIPGFKAPDIGNSGINLVCLIFTCIFIIAAFTDFLDGHIAPKVSKDTIEKYGVVLPEVAIEMAEGGRKVLKVDICVSVTGNAAQLVN
ncbi:hypothetical protein H8356DRAFT_1088509 [Neocallimastix lanati (nom. inval.)]|nr:hypothetical protein H8356DRAFT_1088509 [Neocallimastix sp. JGI-2020a]